MWLVSKLVHVVAVEGITAERVIFAASDNNRVQMLTTHLHDGASQVVGVATTTADAAEKSVETKDNGKEKAPQTQRGKTVIKKAVLPLSSRERHGRNKTMQLLPLISLSSGVAGC